MAVVVLNYRHPTETIACISSLKQLEYHNLSIIVVDNASGDGSLETILAAHPDIVGIQSPVNGGFSAGNNLGIQKALENPESAYVWILNNDTTVPQNGLSHLVETAQRFPNSMIGPKIAYPDGRFQRVGNWLTPWTGKLKSYAEHQLQEGQVVEALSGCSMLIPRPVFETVGLWDERYFLYFEDNAFCAKAKKAGFDCRVALKATVFHHEGLATGENKPLVTYYYQRNRLTLLRKTISWLPFQVVWAYTQFRLLRSTIKTWCNPSDAQKAHLLAFQLAVTDFKKGITGPCPHLQLLF